MVGHSHVMVNGRKLNVPSYLVVPGDKITLRERMRKNPDLELSLDARGPLPDYLNFEEVSFTGTIERLPYRSDIQIPVDEQLVVEYYSRKT